jgi:hypothetical protein
MSSTTTQIPKWNIYADYVEACNCDYGCPCNFNGFPTYGSCHALVLIHIRSGSYGDIRLDGLDFVALSIGRRLFTKEMVPLSISLPAEPTKSKDMRS